MDLVKKIIIPALACRLNQESPAYQWYQQNAEALHKKGIYITYYVQGEGPRLESTTEIEYLYAPLAGSAKNARKNYINEFGKENALYLFCDDDVVPLAINDLIKLFDFAHGCEALVGAVLFDGKQRSTLYYFARYLMSKWVQLGHFHDVRVTALLHAKLNRQSPLLSDRIWGGMFCMNSAVAKLYAMAAEQDRISAPNFDIRFSLLLNSLGIATYLLPYAGCQHHHINYTPLSVDAKMLHHETLLWYYGRFTLWWAKRFYQLLNTLRSSTS